MEKIWEVYSSAMGSVREGVVSAPDRKHEQKTTKPSKNNSPQEEAKADNKFAIQATEATYAYTRDTR